MLTTKGGNSSVFSSHVEFLSEYLLTFPVLESLLVLLEMIAKNGFTPRGGHSDFNGQSGPRQRQPNNDDTRPEAKPSEKSYTADQLDSVRR